MTEVTEAMCSAGRDVQRTWTHDLLTSSRFRAIYLAMEAARIPAPAPDDPSCNLCLDLNTSCPDGCDLDARAPDDVVEELMLVRNCIGDLRNGFAKSVDPARWVEQALATFDKALSAIPIPATGEVERETLDVIAAMMSEFVDNWPQPKKVKTALALVAKTMRAALDPPQHVYWRAGEPDCPRELKAGNGELHTLRCKVCGLEDFRANSVCRASLTDHTTKDDE